MDNRIVNLRALAIILIVLGHSIIIYDPTFDLLKSDIDVPVLASLKHFISFIQLKLFFSISGYLLYFTINKKKGFQLSNYTAFIIKKARRLLIPMLVICFFWMDPVKVWLHIEGYTPDINFVVSQLELVNIGHLWYLPCLFLIFVLSYPLLKIGGVIC